MALPPSDNRIDLVTAAERLRNVRTACRRFLMLWAMSPAKGTRDDRVLANAPLDDPETLLRDVSDPQNRDWSFLFRGSVMDD
jgi:hypothetical protein